VSDGDSFMLPDRRRLVAAAKRESSTPGGVPNDCSDPIQPKEIENEGRPRRRGELKMGE
jgi:hypothetical protein